jgi:PilZ domain
MFKFGFLNFAEALTRPRVGNRRITIRYRCAPATVGKVIATEDQEFQHAWIDNLSRGGAGIFLTKPIAEGSVIVIQLKAPVGDNLYELNGQVMHAVLREPYGWYLGIEFLETLSDDALDALL